MCNKLRSFSTPQINHINYVAMKAPNRHHQPYIIRKHPQKMFCLYADPAESHQLRRCSVERGKSLDIVCKCSCTHVHVGLLNDKI